MDPKDAERAVAAHAAELELLEFDATIGMWRCAVRADRMFVKSAGHSDEEALEGCLEMLAAHWARGTGQYAELGGEGGGWS